MFDRKDIVNLKKDIEIVVNLLDNELTLNTRWGILVLDQSMTALCC